MKFYCEEMEQVLSQTKSKREGLTSAEAQKRLAENGKNKLAEAKKDSLLKQQQLLRKNESDTAAKECALAEEKDACRSYLETYANDRTLVEKKARWQEQISFCHDRQRKLQTGVSAIRQLSKNLKRLRQNYLCSSSLLKRLWQPLLKCKNNQK